MEKNVVDLEMSEAEAMTDSAIFKSLKRNKLQLKENIEHDARDVDLEKKEIQSLEKNLPDYRL